MPFYTLAFGSNSSGKLGIGHNEDTSSPTSCLRQGEPPPSKALPAYVASGGNHTIVVNKDGTAWASGENGNGRCSIKGGKGAPNRFMQVAFEDEKGVEVKHFGLVCATWEASIFVTIGLDAVFVCGTGSKGELGLGEEVIQCPTPKKIEGFPPSGTRIVGIAACMSHTVAVLSNGEAYGWGVGRKGQLGEPALNVWSPRKIEGVSFLVGKVACGRSFTYLVATANSPSHLVLGEDKWGVRSRAPAAVPAWKCIGASWGSIYVLANDGKLWCWGRDDHGQLPPSHLPVLEEFVVGSEHVLAKDTEGDILAWGWGEHGNCGEPTVKHGEVENPWNIVYASNFFSLLGAGCATSFVTNEYQTLSK